MFLPILGYDDGYGFTYGGRVSTIGMLGMGERLSVPLTWGGTRRAAIEVDRTFKTGPLTRVVVDLRHLAAARTRTSRSTTSASPGRAAPSAASRGSSAPASSTSQSTVDFGDARRSAVDARCRCRARHARRPGLPAQRRVPQRRLDRPARRAASTNPSTSTPTDARGYLGVIGQAVLAGRVQYYIGGPHAPRLRAAAARRRLEPARLPHGYVRRRSAVRRRPRSCGVPLTSVLSGAKLGVTAFFDAGKGLRRRPVA